jgi:hypothetical protein
MDIVWRDSVNRPADAHAAIIADMDSATNT